MTYIPAGKQDTKQDINYKPNFDKIYYIPAENQEAYEEGEEDINVLEAAKDSFGAEKAQEDSSRAGKAADDLKTEEEVDDDRKQVGSQILRILF